MESDMEIENGLVREERQSMGGFGAGPHLAREATARFSTGKALAVGTVAALLFGMTIIRVAPSLTDTEAYQLGRITVERDAQVIEAFGRPLSVGRPRGSIQSAGKDAAASLAFSVRGGKARGTAFLDAHRSKDHWDIDHLVVESDDGARTQLR
jgi:hypothetical protein